MLAEVAAGERAERERREDAEGAVQITRERAVRQREADREEEVLEELHVSPEAPGRRDEAARRGIEARVRELVLRLVAPHRRRHHGERLGDQHGGADEKQRPRRAELPAVERTQRADEEAAAEYHDDDAEARDGHRSERVDCGKPEAGRCDDAEARRDALDEPVRLVRGQRAEDAQADEAAGGGRAQHEHEQPEIDHRVLRMPTYPSQ